MGVLITSKARPSVQRGRIGMICVRLMGLWLAPQLAQGAAVTEPPLRLPTPNRALLQPGGEEDFFVGTAGHPYTHGMFGCTRTGGWQFHEGIDIRATARDQRNEPTDPVYATAQGWLYILLPDGQYGWVERAFTAPSTTTPSG